MAGHGSHGFARRPRDHAPMQQIATTELIRRFHALPAAGHLLATLAAADDEVYVVGGAVRDLVTGAVPLDLDLVVVGDVGDLAARLAEGMSATRVHDRFGTATLRAGDGVRYDLARARRETYPRPGALPEVAPAGIEADLARRDFTVNALALGISGLRENELLGVGQALQDLAAGRLRVLHDASFADDPTRLLRLARYAARLGYDAEPHTAALARAAVADGALATVSGPRIGAELELLAGEPDPLVGFDALRAFGVDAALMSGFGITDAALARRALDLLPADGDRAALLLGIAGWAIDPEALGPWLDALGVTAARRQTALAVRMAQRAAAGLAIATRASEIADAVAGLPPEAVAMAGALGPQDQARAWLERVRSVTRDIGGEDLLAAGVPAGPAIGRGLRAALAAKLDGRADTRDAQLAEALRAIAAGD